MNQLGFGWNWEWSSLRVAVIGLGKSGFSAADTLHELGCDLEVLTADASPEHADLLGVLGVPLRVEPNIELAKRLDRERYDLILVSPGIPPVSEIGAQLAQSETQVMSEVDLAWRLGNRDGSRPNWLTVTGTNGKTTITELTNQMLISGGVKSIACGNIGTPVLDAIRSDASPTHLVVELSSFQLHYLDQIEPTSSLLSNIAEDHLDWHGGWDAYVAAKARIFENTRIAAVYNLGYPITEELLREAEVIEGCRAIGYGMGIPAVSEIGYVEGLLVDRAFLEERREAALEIMAIEDLPEASKTKVNLENIAAAAALARSVGVEPRHIRDALVHFRISPHRQELISTHSGVRWINDSKATNAHATQSSLQSHDSIVWIVGGLLKGVDIAPLVSENRHRLRGVVLIGSEPEPWKKAFSELAPNVPLFEVGEPPATASIMTVAVRGAAELAKPGDTVLLAPAAASMDQFRDYQDRGDQFREAVMNLLEQTGEVSS